MSEAAVLLLGFRSAAVVWLAMRRVRGRPRSMTRVLGVAFAAVGLGGGLLLLPVDDAPHVSLGSVGFVPPWRPLPGKGFAVGMAISVSGCSNPVRVSVVFAGTRDYWAEHRPRKGDKVWASFAVILPGSDLSDVHVGFAHLPTDLISPEQAAPWTQYTADIQSIRTKVVRGLTIVYGSAAYWNRSLQPLLATFPADWLSARGLSTCYLQLPQLTGAVTASAAISAMSPARQVKYKTRGDDAIVGGEPYAPELDIAHGTLAVTVARGEVMPDASLPAPDSVVDGYPAWTCSSIAETVGPIDAANGLHLPDVLTFCLEERAGRPPRA